MPAKIRNDTSAVATSSLGRVSSVDYVNGRLDGVIDKLPARGEAPVHGPIV